MGFEDDMIEDGFRDEQEYLNYLCDEAGHNCYRNYSDYNEEDWCEDADCINDDDCDDDDEDNDFEELD